MNNLRSREDRLPDKEVSSREKSHDFFNAAYEVAHYITMLRTLASPDFTKKYGQELRDLQDAYTRGEDRLNLSKTSIYAVTALKAGQRIFYDETVWQAVKQEGGAINNFTYTRDQLKAYMSESIQNTRTLIGRF
jgi:hypothetical protein